MKFRKGIFLVVYRKEKSKILYLVLKRKLHWKGWEFVKGGIEKGENSLQAVKRELEEESGLRGKIFDMKKKKTFLYPHLLKDRPGIKGMSYHLYAIQVSSKKVKIDKREHTSYKWLGYKQAYKLLTFSDMKKALRVVNIFLTSK